MTPPEQREDALTLEKTSAQDEPAPGRLVWRRLALLAVLGLFLLIAGGTAVIVRSGNTSVRTISRDIPVNVSCPEPTFCVAVDDQGNAIVFNGTSWSAPHSVSRSPMNSVSCPSRAFCAAVDTDGDAVTFDGLSWSEPTLVDSPSINEVASLGLNGVTSVSCRNRSFCMAVDAIGNSLAFNGTTWSTLTRVDPNSIHQQHLETIKTGVVGVSCPSTTFCVAATVLGVTVISYGGRGPARTAAWSKRNTLEPAYQVKRALGHSLPSVTAVSCPSTTFCVALDPFGNVFVFNGRTWSGPKAIDAVSATRGNGTGLRAVSCSSTTFCVAVDGLGRALSFNGTRWSAPRPVDPTLGLTRISCASPTFCVALNDIGEAIIFNGRSWSTPRAIDR